MNCKNMYNNCLAGLHVPDGLVDLDARLAFFFSYFLLSFFFLLYFPPMCTINAHCTLHLPGALHSLKMQVFLYTWPKI